MRKLIIIPLFFFSISVFGQFTKNQLYNGINLNIRNKGASQLRLANMLDSIVVSMGSGGGSMVYPGAGIPLSTGSAWGTSITDNSAVWNTAITTTGTQALTGNKIISGSGSNYNLSLGDAGSEIGNFDVKMSGAATVTSTASNSSSLSVGGTTGYLRNGARGYEATPTGIFIFANAGQYIEGDVTGFKFVLGSDASQDLYKRDPSGHLVRIPLGSSGDVLTNVSGTVGWAAPSGGSGTVTSVAASVPSVFSISGSPITTSGTLAMTYSGTALPVANGGTGLTSLGSGVATWFQTPSYSNLSSALTGTSLWPLLASGGTVTGAYTLTSNTVNQFLKTGTATTTANNQYQDRLAGSYTLRGTTSDEFYTGLINPTLIAGANSQKTVGLKINPTFTNGAFSSVSNVGLLVETGSVFIGTGIMNSTTKFSVRGIGDTSGTVVATFKNGTGNDLLYIQGDGAVRLRDAGTIYFRGNEFMSSPADGQLTFSTNSAALTTGAYRYRWGGSSSTSGVIPTMLIESSGSVNPSSGTATFPSVQVKTPYNVTGGTANGISFYSSPIITLLPTLTGFKHEPTNPSNITTNIAFHAVTGQSLFGGSTVTASTTLDVRGVSSGTALRVANNSNTELWDFKNDGSLEIGGSAGTSGYILTSAGATSPPTWVAPTNINVQANVTNYKYSLGGFPAGTTGSLGTPVTSAQLANGESVTIVVHWSAMDGDSNTGAGGTFITTWTKSGGTLNKVMDLNTGLTGSDTGDALAVSSSDSGGDILLSLGTGTIAGNMKASGIAEVTINK